MTIALKKSGFVLYNRYVIHSENQSSVHIAGQNALIHDVILVLAKNSSSNGKKWKQPDIITKKDSHTFCGLCGSLLGYLLSSDMNQEQIRQVWNEKIRNGS